MGEPGLPVPPLSGRPEVTLLSKLLHGVAERLHAEFAMLMQGLATQPDPERKRATLAYLHSARQQLLRLSALVQWSLKARPVGEITGPGKLLDVAARHGMEFQHVADELYGAHERLRVTCTPMSDVATAVEVLATGGYNDLPAAISQLRPRPPPPPERRAVNARTLGHLIYSRLLKASLPPALRIVDVRDGCLVVRLDGLYEAKLTLIQAPKLVLPPKPAAQEGGAGGAGGDGPAEDADADSLASGRAASAAQEQRWIWALLACVMLPGAAHGAPLVEAQIQSLLRDLNNRMQLAADAAVFNKHMGISGGGTAAAGGANGGGASGQVTSSACPAAGGSMLSGGPSHTGGAAPSGAATSAATGSGDLAAAANDAALLQRFSQDDVTLPLLTGHVILRDIAVRLLLDRANRSMQALTAAGGRWAGSARVEPATGPRKPGIRIYYWTKAVLVVPGAAARAAAAAAVAAPGDAAAPAAAGPSGSRLPPPAVEVGMNRHGALEVVHVPPVPSLVGFTMPGACDRGAALPAPFSALRLDTHTVNVEQALLQAGVLMARCQLMILEARLSSALTKLGVLPGCSLHLAYSTQHLWGASASAAAAAAAAATASAGATAPEAATTSAGAAAADSSALVPQPPPAPSSASASGPLPVPFLEFCDASGAALLRASYNLFTGRLLLQPGPGCCRHGDELEVMSHFSGEEDRVNELLASSYERNLAAAAAAAAATTGAGAPQGSSGESPAKDSTMAAAKALQEVAVRLGTMCHDLAASVSAQRVVSAAAKAGLRWGPVPAVLLQQFASRHPGTDVLQHQKLMWCLPDPREGGGTDSSGGGGTRSLRATGATGGSVTAGSLGAAGAVPAQAASTGAKANGSTRKHGLGDGGTPEGSSAPVEGIDELAQPALRKAVAAPPPFATSSFYLGTELQLGSGPPSYSLIMCSKGRFEVPCRVLKAIPVPASVAVAPCGSSGLVTAGGDAGVDVPLRWPGGGARKRLWQDIGDNPAGGHSPQLSHYPAGKRPRPVGADAPAVAAPSCAAGALSSAAANGCDRPAHLQKLDAELGAVLRWCHGRVQREQLLYALRALGLQFLEPQAFVTGGAAASSGSAPPALVVTHLPGGLALPFTVPRRQAGTVSSGAVGLMRLELRLVGVDSSGVATALEASVRARLFGAGPPSAEALKGLKAGGVRVAAEAGGAITLRYPLRAGVGAAAAALVRDGWRLLRMQGLLARLEHTALPAQVLPVTAFGTGGKKAAAAVAAPPPAPCGHDVSGAALTWTWLEKGPVTITLRIDSATCATLAVAATPVAQAGAPPEADPPLVVLQIEWQERPSNGESCDASLRAGADGSCVGSGSQEPVALCCAVTASSSSGVPLPPGYLAQLSQLAEAGEESMLLDALAIAARGQAGLAAAAQPASLEALGLGLPRVRLVPGASPFQHRLVVAAAAATGDGAAAGGRDAVIDARFMAAGVTWLKLLGGWGGGSGGSSSSNRAMTLAAASPDERFEQECRAHLGELPAALRALSPDVHLDAQHSRPQQQLLWVLVPNALLPAALRVALSALAGKLDNGCGAVTH